MAHRGLIVSGALAAAVALASSSVAGQARPAPAGSQARAPTKAPAKAWTHPHTAWGDPDLQGIWVGGGALPLERPIELGDRPFYTEAEVEQRIKDATKAAEARRALVEAGGVEHRGFRGFPIDVVVENSGGLLVDIFRAAGLGEAGNRRTSAIVDPPNGRLPPWTLEQVKRWEEREAITRGRGETDTADDMNLNTRCIESIWTAELPNWGLAFGGGANKTLGQLEVPSDDVAEDDGGLNAPVGPARQILQIPGFVAISFGGTAYRVVRLDGRPHPGRKIRQWLGDSRGRWAGNTLVVETTNITYGSPIIPNYGGKLYPGSGETLTITERFTRGAADRMEYRYTIDDPGVYTRPYTVLLDLNRNDNARPAPTGCQENPKDLANALANARADEYQSLLNGDDSRDFRRPWFEEVKQAAIEEAARQRSTASPASVR